MSEPTRPSGVGQFLAEMRRRHVVRFALGYAAAAFVLLQLAEIVFPAFGFGEGGLRLLVVVVGLGFPPSLVLAWMYDLTTEGIQRTDGSKVGPLLPRLALGALLIATVGAAGGVGLYLNYLGIFENEPASSADRRDPVQLVAYDPEAPIRSIAVLPLDDYSPSGDQAYFTAGMHEEIIAKLSGLEQLRVVSRTSVMRYAGSQLSMPQIGRELDVDVVVEGSVTRVGDRTKVTLQLIHAPSDSHIETLQWDREDVVDILGFQSEVAWEVVGKIADRDERTFVQTASAVEPAAQDAYLRGRYQFETGTSDGYRNALAFFEQALLEDSSYAPAMAGVAGARFLLGLEESAVSVDEAQRAHEEALAALALDSSSVEAQEVLALIERSVPGLMVTRTVSETGPAEGRQILVSLGAQDSVVLDMTGLDTTWVSAITSLGERIEARVREHVPPPAPEDARRAVYASRQLMMAGKFAEAGATLESALEANPQAGPAWEQLARVRIASGDAAGAADAVREWNLSGAPNAPAAPAVAALHDSMASSGSDGYWQWHLARLQTLVAGGDRVPHVEIAAAHAALGQNDAALQELSAALSAEEPGLLSLRSDPVWDDLRSDPRMRDIVRQAQRLRFSSSRRPPRGSGG